MSLRALFSWVHLSDLHFGHGDSRYRWDQRLVLDELAQDVPRAMDKFQLPAPDAILVTGDVAFSGATRNAEEYDMAAGFLQQLSGSIGIGAAQVFTVPGNHDVQRSADNAPAVRRLVRSLRENREQIDTIMEAPEEQTLLLGRQSNYLRFADGFAPYVTQGAADATRVHWSYRTVARGLQLRLIGLNTALLSAGDDDQGKLQLGLSGPTRALLEPPCQPDELVVVLSHHPLQGGWLCDEADVDRWLRSRAHLHLCGHIHAADTESLRRGGQREFVRIAAGAAHGERQPPGQPSGHGYSFGTILLQDDGTLFVRVWPRLFTDENRAFRIDARLVPDGQSYAQHPLGLKIDLKQFAVRVAGKPADDVAPILSTASANVEPGHEDIVRSKQQAARISATEPTPPPRSPGDGLIQAEAVRRSRLLKLIEEVLVLDSDLDMFCLTYFHPVFKRFSQGMDRKQKHVLLLASTSQDELVASLRDYDPERFAQADANDRRLLSR